jgi:hypothetical protein
MSRSTGRGHGLSAAQVERLALLAQQAGALSLLVGRILRVGYDNYKDSPDPIKVSALERELGGMQAVITLMCAKGDIDTVRLDGFTDAMEDSIRKKRNIYFQE